MRLVSEISIMKLVPTMSYELVNQSIQVYRKYSRQFWPKAMELACLYGWRPLGTVPPRSYDFSQLNAEWDGTYLTNDGQLVKSEDALSLATALSQALDDIPDTPPPLDWSSRFWWEDDLPEWLSPEEKAILEDGLLDGLLDILGTHPFAFFAGEEKRQLVELIRFCRLGCFAIL